MLPDKTTISVYDDDAQEYIHKNICDVCADFANDSELGVCSYENKKIKQSNISSTRSSSSKDFICITFADSAALILTPDQKVYDASAGEWKRSADISTKTPLLDESLNTIIPESIHIIKDSVARKVYTLSIENTECYFANGILVHNEHSITS